MGGGEQQTTGKGLVPWGEFGAGRQVLPWHDEGMVGRLGMDILEGRHKIVLINPGAHFSGNDAAASPSLAE